MNRLRLIFVLMALCGALVAPHSALAHANLSSSAPAENSTLQSSPPVVAITFTEQLVSKQSAIRVLDVSGKQVDKGDSAVSPIDGTTMSVSLPPLPEGVYTVAWNTVSDMDGHAIRGSFLFSVGVPLSSAPAAPPTQPLFQSPAEPVIRWLELLGLFIVVGGLVFRTFILTPVFRLITIKALERDAGRLLDAMFWVALVMSVAAATGRLVLQAMLADQGASSGVLGAPLLSALETRFGMMWLLFVAMLVLLGACVTVGRTKDAANIGFRNVAPFLAIALGAGALLTVTLTSHGAAAAASMRWEAELSDYLHILSAAIWIGGLINLAATVPLVLQRTHGAARRYVLLSIVPRFSVVAALCLGTVIVTGIFNGYAQVTTFYAVATPYGLTLIVKIVLAGALIAFGAMNLLWVSPRLRRRGAAGRWLWLFVTGEAVLGVLVLLAVGVLTSLEPARQVASRQLASTGRPLTFQDSSNGTAVSAVITPGRLGANRVEVRLKDALGHPVANATAVNVRLSYLGADLGEPSRVAVNAGGGLYTLDQSLMSIAGDWQVEVSVQRLDALDANAAFRFGVVGAGAASSATIAPDPRVAHWLFAFEILLIGAVFLATSLPLGMLRTVLGRSVAAPGLAIVAAGVFVLFARPPAALPTLTNPFPPTDASITSGRALYMDKCVVCHGATGRGDGPAAATLNPKPFDLTIHVPLHSQAVLFLYIKDGIPATAMPAWGRSLSDDQIWHLINYLETLPRRASATPRPTP